MQPRHCQHVRICQLAVMQVVPMAVADECVMVCMRHSMWNREACHAGVPPPEPQQPPGMLSAPGMAPPASLTWASLDRAPSSSQPEPADTQQRIAGSAGASTSDAQGVPGQVRRRGRRRSEALPEAACASPVDSAEALAASVVTPPAPADTGVTSRRSGSSRSGSSGAGAGGGDEEALRLAAAVAEVQNRRCPPLGRFGHGSANALKVTTRLRTLPFAIKVRCGLRPAKHGEQGACGLKNVQTQNIRPPRVWPSKHTHLCM